MAAGCWLVSLLLLVEQRAARAQRVQVLGGERDLRIAERHASLLPRAPGGLNGER